MYNLIETQKHVTVDFSKTRELRDAPSQSFPINKRISKAKAKQLAIGYAEGIVNLYDQTKNLSAARKVIPGMSDDKVNICVEFKTNKTGVVGVYLERAYDRLRRGTPYAYTANYTMNGKQFKKRFPLEHYQTDEDAFRAAVAFRLLSINLNKDMLQ